MVRPGLRDVHTLQHLVLASFSLAPHTINCVFTAFNLRLFDDINRSLASMHRTTRERFKVLVGVWVKADFMLFDDTCHVYRVPEEQNLTENADLMNTTRDRRFGHLSPLAVTVGVLWRKNLLIQSRAASRVSNDVRSHSNQKRRRDRLCRRQRTYGRASLRLLCCRKRIGYSFQKDSHRRMATNVVIDSSFFGDK